MRLLEYCGYFFFLIQAVIQKEGGEEEITFFYITGVYVTCRFSVKVFV